jgi:hypoxia up-regulated 1
VLTSSLLTYTDPFARKLEAPIILRFQESRTRPRAVEDFQTAMFAGRAFLVEAMSNNTIAKDAVAASTPESPAAPPKYTDEELSSVEALLKELEEWVDPIMSQQVFLEADKTETPVVMTQELDERGKRLQSTVSTIGGYCASHQLTDAPGSPPHIQETASRA